MSKTTVVQLEQQVAVLTQRIVEMQGCMLLLTTGLDALNTRIDLRQQHAEARATTSSIAAPQRAAVPVPAWQQERRAALAAAKAKAIAQGCSVRV